MTEIIEQVGQHYPASAEHLKALPDHLAEQVGEVALRLTHVDMHPAETVQGEYGKEFQKIDFDHVITDPEYDISQLEAQAVEAAEAGKEKVAGVLYQSTSSLKSAHDQLLETGYTFGSTEPETDEARLTRETRERDDVYAEAFHQTIEAAAAAKASGDIDGATKLMESLVLLNHLNPVEHRVVFRQAVRLGLADELLTAGQEARKMFTGDDYHNVASELGRGKKLLEYSTGKLLDYSLEQRGDFSIDSGDSQISFEDYQDLLMVATIPNAPFTLQQALELGRHYVCTDVIKERLINTSPEDISRILLETTEIIEPSDMEYVFRFAEPGQAWRAVKSLGIAVWRLERLVGHKAEGENLMHIADKQVADLQVLKQTFPDEFGQLMNDIWLSYGLGRKQPHDALAIRDGLQSLRETGANSPMFYKGLCTTEDVPHYVEACQTILEEIGGHNMSPEALEASLSKVSPRYDTIRDLVNACMRPDTDTSKVIERLATTAQVYEKFREAYEKLEYPMVNLKESEVHVPLTEMPEVSERLHKLGLSPELSEAIYDSWDTFEAYVKHYYNSITGFEAPSGSASEAEIGAITREQVEAIMSQLEAIESYSDAYGNDSLHEVIQTFGIYNFGRHKPPELHDQLERWQNGDPARSVVVNARSDWNSFTGKAQVFDEVEGQGTFVFEANSGTEAARIAVLIGKREREQGREPNVRRFILHAHGNQDGMVMGVHRELIDTTAYRQASRKRSKIPHTEINDYKRHLGENFEVVLQSCSTAAEQWGGNIAEMISKQHDVKVLASAVTITGIKILSDGSVEFTTGKGPAEPVTYQP